MLLVALLFSGCSDRNAVKFYNQGNAEAHDDMLMASVQLYDKALLEEENFARALNNRGASFQAFDDCEKAQADFDMAIELDEDYYESYYNRGTCFLLVGSYDESLADFDHALSLNPTIYGAYYGRGVSHYQLRELEKSLDDFSLEIAQDNLKLDALNNEIANSEDTLEQSKLLKEYDKIKGILNASYYGRGRCQQKLHYYSNAIKDYMVALVDDSTSLDTHLNLAYCQQQLEQYEAAIGNYEYILENDTNLVFAMYNSGVCYYELASTMHRDTADPFFRKAIIRLDEAIKIIPEMAEALYYKGAAYQSRYNFYRIDEHWDSAMTAYTATIELNDQLASAFFNRGNLYVIEGSADNELLALADYAAVIDLEPNYKNAWYMRGVLRYGIGDPDGACEDFSMAVQYGHKEAGKEMKRLCGTNPPTIIIENLNIGSAP